MRPALALLVVLTLVALGCGGGGGREDAAPIVEPPPATCSPGEWLRDDGTCVAAGLPPDMACPPGEWQRDDGKCSASGVPPDGCGEGFVHDGDCGCEPILPESPCPPGLMAVPGETACREVAPCASGRWGDIPIEPDTEYVDASYAGIDSDGSALKPWTSLQTAVDAAASRAIVAIAEGSYLEDVTVNGKPVRLWGVCPSLVEVVGTGAKVAAIRVLEASGSEVRDLAIRGEAAGFVSSGSIDVLLERVWVHDNASRGINVQNTLGPTGVALRASLIEQNYEFGFFALGSEATVEASVVRATQPTAALLGRGVNVVNDETTGLPSQLRLRTSIIEQNHDVGVFVSGSEATVEASVVRTTQPDAQGLFGRGVEVQTHATAGTASFFLRTSLVEQNHEIGLFVSGSEATVEASVVRATQPDAHGGDGRGMEVVNDSTTGAPSTLLLRTSLVEQNHDVGVSISGSAATVEASVVRATQPTTQGGGRGVNVQTSSTTGAPAKLFLSTSLVEQNHDVGLFVFGSEATVEASVVRATQPKAQGLGGRGIEVQTDPTTSAPAALHLRASLVEQNHAGGLFVSGSEATVVTSVVRGTQPVAGRYGHGIAAQAEPTTAAPSTLLLEGSVIEQSYEAGVIIIDSIATVRGCLVRDTRSSAEGLYGSGLVVVFQGISASATITGTHIDRSALAAIAVWGAHAAIGASALTCQAFDLDYEPYSRKTASFEDLGSTLCGCPEATATCVAVTANFEPPKPLEPTTE